MINSYLLFWSTADLTAKIGNTSEIRNDKEGTENKITD